MKQPIISKRKEVKPPIAGYKELVAHICETFKTKKGSAYPFMAESGAQVKKLLRLYGLFQSMALWDIFLAGNWDWVRDGKRVRVAHDLRNFLHKITILVEEDWKTGADRYEKESSARFQPEFPIEFKKMPKPEDSQANKKKVVEVFEKVGK